MTGTVLFIDNTRWTSFDQFAAVLRRRGCRTVRATTELGRLSRLTARLMYDRHVVIGSLPDLRSHGEIDFTDVIDIQCPETLLEDAVEALEGIGVPERTLSRLRRRTALLDKHRMSGAVAEGGAPAPRTAAGTTSVAEALRSLGRPLMVKGRVGHGGIAVRRADDAQSAERAVVALGGPDATYFEELIDGDLIQYVACRSAGRVAIEATYVSGRRDAGSLGAATVVQITDDPELRRVGRLALDAIDAEGLANIDVLRDRAGRLHVIDVNLRIWGCAAALRLVGLNFVGAYLDALADRADGSASWVRRSRRRHVEIFPDSAIAAIRGGSVARGLASGLSGALLYARWFGLRYATAALVELGAALRRRARSGPA